MPSQGGGPPRFLSRRWGSAALGLLGLFFTHTARAENATELRAKAFRVVFSSSTGCTDATEFSSRLQEMTSQWRPASNGEPSYTFFVHLSATQAGAHGQLGVLEPSGALTLRELETADCHTLISALAFIGAVMADPFTVPPRVSVPAPRPRRVRSREQVEMVRPWRVSLGAVFGVEGGVAPSVSPSAGLLAEVSHVTGVVLDPSLRLSFRIARATDSFVAGSAAFTLRSARLLLCPVRVQGLFGIDVRPCAAFDAGELSAQGFGTVENKQSSLFWSAAGAEALVDVLRVGRFTLGLDGGLLFPLRRDGFYFDTNPDVVVHTIPAVAASGAVSLSVRTF